LIFEETVVTWCSFEEALLLTTDLCSAEIRMFIKLNLLLFFDFFCPALFLGFCFCVFAVSSRALGDQKLD
jgi:hypothetical protein